MEHRLEVADVFRQHEQEFFAAWGHTLSQQQRRVFRDICACRTASLGAHVQRCDSCAHESISYNSCRSRHCPKCRCSVRARSMQIVYGIVAVFVVRRNRFSSALTIV